MMMLASIQSGLTLPESQPKFHFKHFSEKPRKLVRANPSPSSVVVGSFIVSWALHSEFKLLEMTRDFQQRKPRCLCLHGFRTNGDILKKRIQRWPEYIHKKIDFLFVDAPFPAEGKSDVEGMFDTLFYEWFQFSIDYMKYRYFYKCLAYVENCMLKHGPFDGVLGFSQGAFLAAALPGLQASGVEKEERKIGNNGENHQQQQQRKPRFLCLHGFRTNGEILKKQVQKWPESVLSKMDLMFVDAPFPAEGKSDVEGIFDPPYYEWFQSNHDQSEFKNFDKGLAHIENFMLKHGPFDGLLGFSQGAFISGALPGLQEKGLALTKVPKIKFLIIIGGGKCLPPTLAKNAYSSPIEVPSLHFLGDRDYMKPNGMKLMESFVDPLVIHHRRGHTVPRLEKKDLEIMINFLERIQCSLIPSHEEPISVGEDVYRENHMYML